MKIPKTLFSTNLSSSFKETELRIRNIFQWKKKRPPVVLFVLTAVVVLCCFSLFSCVAPEDSSAGDPMDKVTKPADDSGPKAKQDKGNFAKKGMPEQTGDVITDYFNRKLSQLSPDTPLVITEKQTFDWNGTKVVAVTATNIVVTDFEANLLRLDEPHPDPNLPESEYTVMYLMSALFVDGQEPIDLMYDEVHAVSKNPLDWAATGVSYDHGKQVSFQQFLSAVQYKTEDMLTTCPVFCSHEGELVIRDYKYHPVYSLEDADGDGEAEFVFFRERSSSLYTKYAVYDWADGTIQRTTDVLEEYRNFTIEESETVRGDDPLTLYWEILLGKGELTAASSGEKMTLERLWQTLYDGRPEANVTPTHFAVADLDADGVLEIVVRLSVYSTREYLILHYRESEVYGYSEVLRGLMDLKADGTFHWSGGAFNNGTGRIRFEENVYTYGDRTIRETHIKDKITYCQSGQDTEGNILQYYFVDYQPATIQEYAVAEARQSAKPDAVWYEFTEENINAQLGT